MKVLVIGRAKTGTTIIARRIQDSLEKADFVMEPDSVQSFSQPHQGNLVVKTIFEHWNDKPHSRMALLNNEMPLVFDRVLFIIRDPRDEFISRLLYLAYDQVKLGHLSRETLSPWLSVLEQKASEPARVSVAEILKVGRQVFGVNLDFQLRGIRKYYQLANDRTKNADAMCIRYEDFVAGRTKQLEDLVGSKLRNTIIRERWLDRVNRTSAVDNWKTFFHPSDLAKFRKRNEGLLQLMGYTDWALTPDSELDPAHYSEFVEKLIDDAEKMAGLSS